VEAGFDEEIRNYCRKAETLHASLPVAGFATRLKVPIDIEEIYVPLRAMLDLRGVVEEECFADSAHAEKVLCGRNAGHDIALPEAFEQAQKRGYRNILILGDPGSGKTTHLKRVLLYCLRKGPLGIGLPDDILPVFLPLRNLQDLKKGLDAFIEGELDSPHLQTPPGFGQSMLRRGKLLYLLDGLDEVADLGQREQVARWIVAAQQADPTCPKESTGQTRPRIRPNHPTATVAVRRDPRVTRTPCRSKWFAMRPGMFFPMTATSTESGKRAGKSIRQRTDHTPPTRIRKTNLLRPKRMSRRQAAR